MQHLGLSNFSTSFLLRSNTFTLGIGFGKDGNPFMPRPEQSNMLNFFSSMHGFIGDGETATIYISVQTAVTF